MEVHGIFLILCAIFAAGDCDGVYDACALAHRLSFYDIPTKYPPVGNVSFAICIAGYRHYNPAHQLTDARGVSHYGVFGLIDVDSYCNREAYRGYSFEVDLDCLRLTVLNDTRNVQMYNRLCASDLVRMINCTDKFGNTVGVADPIYKEIIDDTYGDEEAIVRYLAELCISYYPPQITTSALPTTITTPLFFSLIILAALASNRG